MIKFNTTPQERRLIARIVIRAMKLGLYTDAVDANMDITACHCNGTKLDLEKLKAADDFNFIHDVWGIRRYLNRSTGKIGRFFSPRYQPTKRR